MTVERAKRILFACACAAFAIAAIMVILIASQLVLSTGTGADPSAAFNEIPVVPDDTSALVRWNAEPDLDRPMEPDTRELVASAWVRAWHRIDVVQRTGSADGIETWFVGELAEHLKSAVSSADQSSVSQKSHALTTTFYSIDGSVIGLRAASVLERSKPGTPVIESTEQFEAVLILSDGNWRIRHLTRIAVER